VPLASNDEKTMYTSAQRNITAAALRQWKLVSHYEVRKEINKRLAFSRIFLLLDRKVSVTKCESLL
jgi:hypothetical protein